MICSRIFRSYVTVTTAGEKLQNWALYSVLWAFVLGGVIIVPHLLWHWTSVIPVLSEESTNVVASYDMRRGDVELF